MVLRFRDLMADTIPEHKKQIDQDGYVWWAWWNKPDEKVARHTFAGFQSQIKATGSIPIFLLNSGTSKLFRAKLIEIKHSETEEKIESPEKAKTPIYYQTRQWKAWFKLSEIEEISTDQLRSWSYDEVNEFVADPHAADFQDKRVFSLQEMLGRSHRTIYFLSPYKTEHRDHEIKLSPPIAPVNFYSRPEFRKSNYILLLSDLHFGEDHHGFAIKSTSETRNLASYVTAFLGKHRPDTMPALVVVTGDITWQGKSDEFDMAHEFFHELRSVLGLSIQDFLVVPGNHDIQWASQQGNSYDPTKKVEVSRAAAESNYREFYKKMFGCTPSEHLSCGRRIVLANYTAVDIIGLNSSLLETRHFAGYGFVSSKQLDDAMKELDWRPDNKTTRYRILVLHHHILPVCPKEPRRTDHNYSITLDSGDIMARAHTHSTDLILHGHQHQPFISSIARAAKGSTSPCRNLVVHAAGSAGIVRSETGGIGKNSFSILEVDPSAIDVIICSKSEATDDFERDWGCRLEPTPEYGLQIRPGALKS